MSLRITTSACHGTTSTRYSKGLWAANLPQTRLAQGAANRNTSLCVSHASHISFDIHIYSIRTCNTKQYSTAKYVNITMKIWSSSPITSPIFEFHLGVRNVLNGLHKANFSACLNCSQIQMSLQLKEAASLRVQQNSRTRAPKTTARTCLPNSRHAASALRNSGLETGWRFHDIQKFHELDLGAVSLQNSTKSDLFQISGSPLPFAVEQAHTSRASCLS